MFLKSSKISSFFCALVFVVFATGSFAQIPSNLPYNLVSRGNVPQNPNAQNPNFAGQNAPAGFYGANNQNPNAVNNSAQFYGGLGQKNQPFDPNINKNTANEPYLPPVALSEVKKSDKKDEKKNEEPKKEEKTLPKPENPRAALFNPRQVTPHRMFSAALSKPDVFVNSNDLIRKTGSFYQARGEVITFGGKVTDSFGVPISGAVIEIWQTNSTGKYQNLLEKNSKYLDVHFNMSGRAVTDNLGNYNFITIMPGYYLGRAPHINLNIYHTDFGKLETEFYFEGHPRNKFDYEFLSYSEEDRELLTAKAELIDVFNENSRKHFIFDIVLEGIHKYKGLKN